MNTAQISTSPIGFGGYIHIRLLDAQTREIQEEYEFPNLITDVGMTLLASSGQYIQDHFYKIGVGTGSTAPAYEDTQLEYLIDYSPTRYANVYNTTFATSSVFPLHPFWYFRRSYEYLEDIGNGTISELGYFDISNNMLARALVKDNGGTPTSFTKSNLQILQVDWEIRAYTVDMNHKTSLTLDGTVYGFTSSLLEVKDYDSWGYSKNSGNDAGYMYGMGQWGGIPWVGPHAVILYPSASGLIDSTGSRSDFHGGYDVRDDCDPSIHEWRTYTASVGTGSAGVWERRLVAKWYPNRANWVRGIRGATLQLCPSAEANAHIQVEINPPIYKTENDLLVLEFIHRFERVSVADSPGTGSA